VEWFSLWLVGVLLLFAGAVAWPRVRWPLLTLAVLAVVVPGVLFILVINALSHARIPW
jgi:hypothetical protein